MLVTSVPRALALGARLFADCRVDRITRSGGAVTGVTGHFVRPGGRRGPGLTVRARVVVVAGGAIQTPALLARSGLRSASGQLGRNLSVHPNAVVTAFFDQDVTGWQGVHQAFQVREFLDEGLLLTATNLTPPMLAGILPAYGRELGELMADYNRIVTAGPLVSDTGTGRIRQVPGLGPQVFYQLTDHDAGAGGARCRADRRGAVRGGRPAGAAARSTAPRSSAARTSCAACWPGRCPSGPSSCSRST